MNSSQELIINLSESDLQKTRKKYVRAVVFNPQTKLFLFSYFPNIQGTNKQGLIGGGIDEGEDEVQALTREIIEETGFTDFEIMEKLGGNVLSPKDPEFDTKDIIKQNAAYLVILKSQANLSKTNLSQREIETGFNIEWKISSEVKFGGFYSQYSIFLERALQKIQDLKL